MQKYFLIILLCCVTSLKGQNLIPNPSFEDTLLKSTPLYLPADWVIPTIGSPDLMTPLNHTSWSTPQNFAGYQSALSGNNYIGILMYALNFPSDSKRFREYIQSELSDTLKADSVYCLRMYVSLADSSQFGSKGMLGVHLSDTAISSNDFFFLPYTPQIIVSPDSFIVEKSQWLQFDFQYQAAGGERFITIGNFNDSNLVDTISAGGSVNYEYINTYYYIDDFYLGHCDSLPNDTAIGILEYEPLFEQAKAYPNPSEGHITVEVSLEEYYFLQLHDKTGKVVQEEEFFGKHTQLDLSHLDPGVYFVRIYSDKRNYFQKVVIN